MRIWNGYGSEHSMRLVLIGSFKKIRDAENTKAVIDKIVEQAVKDEAFDLSQAAPEDQRFSSAMTEILRSNRVHSLAPHDLDQFASDHSISQHEDQILVRTEEADLSAFIKIFIDAGARVEIYSAHDYPEDDDQSN